MKIFDVASKYSKALFNLTPSVQDLEKRLNQLQDILKLLDKPYLKNFFASPQISQQQKIEFLKEVLKKNVDNELLSFFLLLLDKKRLKYLPEIAKHYRELIRNKKGIIKARLLTAVPLDEKTRASLKEKLDKMYHKNIEIDNQIDPSLIGGGIIFIGSQMLDFSLNGKLNKLKKDLLA